MSVEFVMVCIGAALYGWLVGAVAAAGANGEQVPFLSATWELLRRPADALDSLVRGMFRRP